MPLFQGTQQGYYEQSQSFIGAGAGNLTVGPVTVAYFATRPTQQVDIIIFINNVEVSKNSYSYNGTSPGDVTVDNSYNLVFNNTNINANIQAADGSPLLGLPILLREVLATEQFGNYQYVSLENIINNFIISYVGEDKIISKIRRADIAFHAQRGLAELSYDTLKSFKSQEIEVPPSLSMKLPHDFVNYVKLSWLDNDGIERILMPTRKTSNPEALIQDSSYGYTFDTDGTLLTAANSETWDKFRDATNRNTTNSDSLDEFERYKGSQGARYGLEPEFANSNGVYFIDNLRGRIFFDSSLSGKIITLKYISDSLGTDGEMVVHKFAEEAMYKHIAYAILATRANTQEYLVMRFKKEKFAATRQAKLRLSNLKSEELTQVMRGKSKIIKH
jgi:hypothetical protein|tara:strand:+ start:56 stop:1222 length:1167 start_codon:yes stop_codon:yes gene_type:complete